MSVAVATLIPLGGPWGAGAGFLYEQIVGDAADSPVVGLRGSENAFTAAAGLSFDF